LTVMSNICGFWQININRNRSGEYFRCLEMVIKLFHK
jgi:hypothetical protein